jgi:hypothetical protein
MIIRLFIFLLPIAFSAVAQTNAAFYLSYDCSRLTQVVVQQGCLTYRWHTARKWGDDQSAPLPQDRQPVSDSHEVVVWLTPKELEKFREWGHANQISRFPKSFPTRFPGPPSYSPVPVKQESLAITEGDTNKILSWNSYSQIPSELTAAVNELVRICKEIEKQRRTE